MAFYEFPGSNFHDLNLDWLLQQMKNCLAEWATTKTEWETLSADNEAFKTRIEAEWDELRQFVTDYFNNLDVSQEISDKINAMAADGSLLALIKSTVQTASATQAATTTTSWLAENITQETGYVLDTTLTVRNAAADSKSTGDKIALLSNDYYSHTEEREVAADLGTVTSNAVMNANMSVQTGAGNNYKISGIIPVIPGEQYHYRADMNYGNCFYIFRNASGTKIMGRKTSSTGGTWETFNDTITIPNNAVSIQLGYFLQGTNHPMIFNKITTSLIANALEGQDAFTWVKNRLSTLTWVAVGDSLTEQNATASAKYHDLIAQLTGITVLNYGRSGTGYGKTYSTFDNFADRVLTLADVDFDVITIFGSFNDLSIDLGTADDTGTDTLGGFINTTLNNLYSVKPFVNVGIILPTPWWGVTPAGTSDRAIKGQQYCAMLLEICRRRSIPVLDLYHNSNLHPDSENFRTEFYANADGVHPNNKGHKKIAAQVLEFLYRIIW